MKPTLEVVHARELVRSQLFGDSLARGSSIGRYAVKAVLGRGGLGVVYRCHDPLLDRDVAVKLLHGVRGRADAHDALLVEARNLARVTSPYIVPVFDVGEIEGCVYLAMELVAGENLRRWLHHGRRTLPEILRVFLDAGTGLAAMHAAGLVHRDFKPENVLLGRDGVARVADFGLARALEAPAISLEGDTLESSGEASARVTALAGTPAYMAPELFAGVPASTASDVFAFSVSLFEALYGARPFAGESITAIIEAAEEGRLAVGPIPAVSSRIREVLRRGLAADRGERWHDMVALMDALRAAEHGVRRRRFATFVVCGMTAMGALAWTAAARAPEDPCSVAQRRFAAYDDARRDEVQRVLAEIEAPGSVISARVGDRLDAFARSWVAAGAAVCDAAADPDFDVRLACLRDRRVDFEALMDGLVRLEVGEAASALDASDALVEPWSCLEPARPPAKVAAEGIAGLRWAVELGEFAAAVQRAEDVLRSIDPERDREALAEALWARGIARVNLGALDEGLADIEDAHHLAVALQDLDLAAESADVLAFNAAMRRTNLAGARAWWRTAESLVARGATRLRNADLAVTAAAIEDAEGDREGAVKRLRIALAEESCADCSAKLSVLEALAATTSGEEGVEFARERLAIVEARYGAGSPNAVEAGVALAGTLYNAGENDEAIAKAEATRRAVAELRGFDPMKVASLLDTLGKAHLAKGETAIAVQRLEEAAAIVRGPADVDSRFGIIVRYDLGRALMEAEDPRAIVQLQEVVAAIESDFGTDAWELAVVLGTLADAQLRQGDREAALGTVDRADAIAAKHASRDVDVRGAGVRGKLAAVREKAGVR